MARSGGRRAGHGQPRWQEWHWHDHHTVALYLVLHARQLVDAALGGAGHEPAAQLVAVGRGVWVGAIDSHGATPCAMGERCAMRRAAGENGGVWRGACGACGAMLLKFEAHDALRTTHDGQHQYALDTRHSPTVPTSTQPAQSFLVIPARC